MPLNYGLSGLVLESFVFKLSYFCTIFSDNF